MLRYKVISRSLALGPGAILKLTTDQSGSRMLSLKPVDGRPSFFEVTAPVEFKSGEIVTVDSELPKVSINHVLLLQSEPGESKKPGGKG